MKRRPAHLLFCLLSVSSIGHPAWPQTQNPAAQAEAQPQPPVPQPVPIIKTTVREVLVPVVVTDPKGHHVTSLKRDDFKVFEDGVPEDIVAFSTTTDSSSPDLSPATV